MNYRSALVMGRPRVVEHSEERRRALDLLVEHLVPGRAETLRSHTRKELAATRVLALSLAEASVKVRSGDPVDDDPPAHVRARAAARARPAHQCGKPAAADAADRPDPAIPGPRPAGVRPALPPTPR